MKARVLIVEDEEYRRQFFREVSIGMDVHFTKDVEEAKKWLIENEYDQIFLDHDLSDEHYAVWREGSDKHGATTGYAVADFIARNGHLSPNAQIVVHSLNPTGRKRMVERMNAGGRDAKAIPFVMLRELIAKI